MNYNIDTTMAPNFNFLRVCLSCWSRLPVSVTRTSAVTCSPYCGKRWSQHPAANTSSRNFSVDSKKFAEKLGQEENPYFEKYKEKLMKLQRENPEEFQEKMNKLQEAHNLLREQRKKELSEKPAEKKTSSSTDETKTGGMSASWPPKSLDEVMKTELIQDKSAEEIEKIWKEYYVSKDYLFGVVRERDYDTIMEKVRVCPIFIYPLPRQDGYEFFLSQFNGKDVYFTPLIMYQKQKENAISCVTLTHFTEFKDDKGIVLMAGQYDSNMMTKNQALILVKQMTMYYSVPGAERFNLVRIFNHMPEKFHYQSLIDEYKKIKKTIESEVMT